MYYHIKHNKINDEVMSYYIKDQNNLNQINEENKDCIINDE